MTCKLRRNLQLRAGLIFGIPVACSVRTIAIVLIRVTSNHAQQHPLKAMSCTVRRSGK
jgi:hypothetical protein